MKQTLLLTNTTETRTISLGTKLGAGGEGSVYIVQNHPSLCIKIYHEKHRTAAQEAKLKAMLAAPPKDPTIVSGHHSICWPTHLVYEDEACSKFLGFAMPRIDTKTFKEYHLLCDKPSATTTTCYRLEHFGTGFTYLHMYVVAMNLASCVASIHTAGHAVGDLNDKNILVSTHDSKITIVDCDSFEIHGDDNTVFPCAVFMPEYSAPEVIRQQTIEDRKQSDNFALAILIFKLLMLNTHPFAARGVSVDHLTTPGDKIADGLYPYEVHEGKDATPPPYALDYAIIPPDIQLLFRKAFVDGHYTPTERPTAHDWITVLRHHFRIMYDKHSARKFMCTRNSLHYYPDHLHECPWCAMKEDYFPTKHFKKQITQTKAFSYIEELIRGMAIDYHIDSNEIQILMKNGIPSNEIIRLLTQFNNDSKIIIGDYPQIKPKKLLVWSDNVSYTRFLTQFVTIENPLLFDSLNLKIVFHPSYIVPEKSELSIPPSSRSILKLKIHPCYLKYFTENDRIQYLLTIKNTPFTIYQYINLNFTPRAIEEEIEEKKKQISIKELVILIISLIIIFLLGKCR